MSFTAILAPLFVQVLLTFALLLWLGYLRVAAIRSGAVQLREVALDADLWPANIRQVANAFNNQLQIPVLYYVLVVLVLVVSPAMPGMVWLGWLFVVTRLIHALIMVTTNNVPRRSAVFGLGVVILGLMWLIFIFGTLG